MTTESLKIKIGKICKECYTDKNRITPLLNPSDCLLNHTQYICGTCGRCICIEHTGKGMQRWNFPFKTADIARLYLRSADYTAKKCCGVYEVVNPKGRVSYKIFADKNEFGEYLKKNKDKTGTGEAVFSMKQYNEFSKTEVRKLSASEAERYLQERIK